MNAIISVTTLIKSGRILSFQGNVPSNSIMVGDIKEVFSSSETWTDLREADMALKWRFSGFRKRFDVFSKLVFAFLPYKFHDLLDEIVADLEICALALDYPETKTVLTESMWKVYLEGGFPCGWEGLYPKGKLRIFWDREGSTPEPENDAHLRRILYQQTKLRAEL